MPSLRLAVCVISSSLFFWGCGGPIQLQPLPSDHPANPEAPEAPVQEFPQALREKNEESSAGGSSPRRPTAHEHEVESGHQGKSPPSETGSRQVAIYHCPMHPEVDASTPGDCPRCGMALEQGGAK
ncbi:MAG: heavy metal-binding domain-containing protein [Acidobacteria bacterium]|nr:heavy metal-binding domain-containing protein [Acidobacteriota bacterium]